MSLILNLQQTLTVFINSDVHVHFGTLCTMYGLEINMCSTVGCMHCVVKVYTHVVLFKKKVKLWQPFELNSIFVGQNFTECMYEYCQLTTLFSTNRRKQTKNQNENRMGWQKHSEETTCNFCLINNNSGYFICLTIKPKLQTSPFKKCIYITRGLSCGGTKPLKYARTLHNILSTMTCTTK